jgi:hypothetical protein
LAICGVHQALWHRVLSEKKLTGLFLLGNYRVVDLKRASCSAHRELGTVSTILRCRLVGSQLLGERMIPNRLPVRFEKFAKALEVALAWVHIP